MDRMLCSCNGMLVCWHGCCWRYARAHHHRIRLFVVRVGAFYRSPCYFGRFHNIVTSPFDKPPTLWESNFRWRVVAVFDSFWRNFGWTHLDSSGFSPPLRRCILHRCSSIISVVVIPISVGVSSKRKLWGIVPFLKVIHSHKPTIQQNCYSTKNPKSKTKQLASWLWTSQSWMVKHTQNLPSQSCALRTTRTIAQLLTCEGKLRWFSLWIGTGEWWSSTRQWPFHSRYIVDVTVKTDRTVKLSFYVFYENSLIGAHPTSPNCFTDWNLHESVRCLEIIVNGRALDRNIPLFYRHVESIGGWNIRI